ncbi:MAG: hypothetical protein EBX16_02880, partial [Burkholderiaceae bacterium]|nr:hypothetical protein [Burkholderiaceae bacterium]
TGTLRLILAALKDRDIAARGKGNHEGIPEEEIAKRRAAWKQPKSRYTRGLLAKYARLASSASLGAVTDLDLK